MEYSNCKYQLNEDGLILIESSATLIQVTLFYNPDNMSENFQYGSMASEERPFTDEKITEFISMGIDIVKRRYKHTILNDFSDIGQ